MKPKKRQPLDFSATPTEIPPEEPKTTPEFPEPTTSVSPEESASVAEALTLDQRADDLAVPPPTSARSRRRREAEQARFAEPEH